MLTVCTSGLTLFWKVFLQWLKSNLILIEMSSDKKCTRSTTKTEEKAAVKEMRMPDKREETPLDKNSSAFDVFSNEEVLTRFADMVSKKINSNLEALIRNLEIRLSETENRVSSLENENCQLKNQLDRHEQYSRRNNIRIYGVPLESNQEDTDSLVIKLVSEKLGVNISMSSIDRSHRLRNTNGKHPPILVKFANYHARASIMERKKRLKGSGVMIAEDLTSFRASLRGRCCEKWGTANVWTRDGVIMVKLGRTIHRVQTELEFTKVV